MPARLKVGFSREEWRECRTLRGQSPGAGPTSLAGDQLHGFGPGGGVAKLAAYGAGDRLRAGLADPTHGHTQVLALDHHDHAAWLENALQGVRHLGRQSLLYLRALRVEVDQPSQLG